MYEKRKKKGFIFTIGDSADCRGDDEKEALMQIYKRVFGEEVKMDVDEMLSAAEEKFEVAGFNHEV